MEVEEFTRRTKKWKRKWKRDRSLDAGKKHGLWGIGDRGRTCPVPSPANGRFTGCTSCWAQPYLRRQLVCIPGGIKARACLLRCWGSPRGGTLRSTLSPSPPLWSWVKSCPHRKNWENWTKFFLLGLPHPPPSPLQRILTTCMSDVRAIPPPIIDGMPCFRSVIRAASWGMRHHDPLQPGPASEFSLILSSTHTLDRELSPSSRGPGADSRLPAAGHAIGLCILFQKSSRAATVAMPKGAHLTIGCYDHHESTKRGRDCAEHPGAAETATRYRSIAPARLDNPFPGPEQLGPPA